MKKIKEVIVVEGKDDTYRIKQSVNADTIETRGSAVSDETIELIKRLNEQRGIIIFTDPDFSGERIRKIIARNVPDAKQAFIQRGLATPKRTHGSLGVEHVEPEVIRKALKHVYTAGDANDSDISKDELFDLNLINGQGAKQKRAELCSTLNIGYVNGKQLLNRLNMFGIKRADLIQAINEPKKG